MSDPTDDTPPQPNPPPRALGWGGAAWRVLSRYLSRGVLYGAIMLALFGIVGALLNAMTVALVIALALTVPVIAVVAMVFPASVAEEVRVSRRAARREELRVATHIVGGSSDENTLDLTTTERLWQVVRSARSAIVFTAILESGMIYLLYLTYVDAGLKYHEPTVIAAVTAILLLPLPTLLVAAFLYATWRGDGEDLELARAERIYREAIEDRAQLAGGLALDEHAGTRGGGELTVQAQAGGLAVHDEVTLGLDASEEEADDLDLASPQRARGARKQS